MKHGVELPEDLRARILEKRGAGEHHFRSCPLCGRLSWITTYSGRPTAIVVEEEENIDRCGTCLEVFQRAPELARWTADVVRYQIEKAKAGDKAEARGEQPEQPPTPPAGSP